MAKKEIVSTMIETFSEFKLLKNIDRTTLVSVLEESFRNVLSKMYGTDENLDVIVNPDKGDCEIWRNREVVADGEITDANLQISLSDAKKIDEYSTQAKALYGKTDAYREYESKSKSRNADQEKALGQQVMDFFAKLGKLRPCEPDSAEALAWARELQAFFTEHYYTCTPQILGTLAQSYAGGGSMTENIDKVGGAGTGEFAKQVIEAYLNTL